jgi:hypothetical protein
MAWSTRQYLVTTVDERCCEVVCIGLGLGLVCVCSLPKRIVSVVYIKERDGASSNTCASAVAFEGAVRM